jgi:hypothetical protein
MRNWLESLPTPAAGIVVVGGFVVLALLIGYAVGRFTSHEIRTAHNDRAGFILAVIGVIYAVLLAFVAIGVWERFQLAQARSYEEAGAIATVYRDAGSFSDGSGLRALLRVYVASVITGEWPRMRQGERLRVSNALLESADREIRGLAVDSPRLANIQAQMLTAIDTALADRDIRLTVDSGGIHPLLWSVLLVGAVITVAFTYLFGFDKTLMQQLMIGGLSFLIGLVLFLILALDYPYRGSIAVGPEAFRSLSDTFTAIAR